MVPAVFFSLVFFAIVCNAQIHMRDIPMVTGRFGQYTTGRVRTQNQLQIQCKGGNACDMPHFQPSVIRCENKGWDGVDTHWTCEASLNNNVRLGTNNVRCEGYSQSGDPYVRHGSCVIDYELIYDAPVVETVVVQTVTPPQPVVYQKPPHVFVQTVAPPQPPPVKIFTTHGGFGAKPVQQQPIVSHQPNVETVTTATTTTTIETREQIADFISWCVTLSVIGIILYWCVSCCSSPTYREVAPIPVPTHVYTTTSTPVHHYPPATVVVPQPIVHEYSSRPSVIVQSPVVHHYTPPPTIVHHQTPVVHSYQTPVSTSWSSPPSHKTTTTTTVVQRNVDSGKHISKGYGTGSSD